MPPKITNWTGEMVTVSGEVVAMNCNVYSVPRAQITWLKDYKPLPPSKLAYGGYLGCVFQT